MGREAFDAFKPTLAEVKKNEIVEVDFEGVSTFTPSWGDEFLRPLIEKFGEKVILINTQGNPSVKATLELLTTLEGQNFKIES